MAQLTPLYTAEDDIPLPDDVRAYLDEHYLAKLRNLHVAHPKLLVIFSGGNAVGKSSLSKLIGTELGALVLENDAVRSMLRMPDAPQHGQAGDHALFSKLTWSYVSDLYERLDTVTENGFIVRDAVVDWYFDRVLPIFEQKGYLLFIIRFELSREKRTELVRSRGGKDWITTERMEELLADHDVHSQRFLEHYTPDVILHDDDLFDHQKVVDALRLKLESLTNH